jgi:hypothetical protein
MQKKAWEIRYKHTAVYVSLSCYFLRRYERYWAARKPFFFLFFLIPLFVPQVWAILGCAQGVGNSAEAMQVLLYMWPHTTIYVSSYCCVCVLILLYMCPHTTICVLILLHMCPHTTIYVSSYSCICVRGQIYSRYCHVCVLVAMQVLLYVYEATYIVVWGHIYRSMRPHI